VPLVLKQLVDGLTSDAAGDSRAAAGRLCAMRLSTSLFQELRGRPARVLARTSRESRSVCFAPARAVLRFHLDRRTGASPAMSSVALLRSPTCSIDDLHDPADAVRNHRRVDDPDRTTTYGSP
jgi:hypothetical protein